MVATVMVVVLRVSSLDAHASKPTSKSATSSLPSDPQKIRAADQYVPGMDFTGDRKLTTFGYELGVQAASELRFIGWLPGDEFAAARKKSQTESAILRKPPKRKGRLLRP